ncbi:Carbonic anhydrase, alpha class [hydrothermal vent metagenome]|uniref:carbonic anhydrase n=1 Tax=hydrothermal vent metagenome TaxID=652676 RepID=A0A3B0ZRJ8_9ZZZZ
MNLQQVFTVAAASAIVISSAFASGGAHWTYEGKEGPSHWGNLSHSYAMCKEGKKQSPIDISTTKKAKLSKINFSYTAQPKEILNNGHTVQVNMKKGSSVTVAGKTYNLLQFHFHAPSEHTINGKPADMVAHFVHQAKDGQLGVVGVLFKAGKTNAALAKLWKYMPQKEGDKNTLAAGITIAKLLPAKTNYYHYSGSLTTPPCSENVNWMVLQTSVSVSTAQVDAFSRVIHKNVRPVQSHHGRMVKSN